MSQMDEKITAINPNRRSPSKEQLWDFVKGSLKQIREINEAYRRLYENDGDQIAILKEIEQSLHTHYAKYTLCDSLST